MTSDNLFFGTVDTKPITGRQGRAVHKKALSSKTGYFPDFGNNLKVEKDLTLGNRIILKDGCGVVDGCVVEEKSVDTFDFVEDGTYSAYLEVDLTTSPNTLFFGATTDPLVQDDLTENPNGVHQALLATVVVNNLIVEDVQQEMQELITTGVIQSFEVDSTQALKIEFNENVSDDHEEDGVIELLMDCTVGGNGTDLPMIKGACQLAGSTGFSGTITRTSFKNGANWSEAEEINLPLNTFFSISRTRGVKPFCHLNIDQFNNVLKIDQQYGDEISSGGERVSSGTGVGRFSDASGLPVDFLISPNQGTIRVKVMNKRFIKNLSVVSNSGIANLPTIFERED